MLMQQQEYIAVRLSVFVRNSAVTDEILKFGNFQIVVRLILVLFGP